jgi:Asp-tRNA(Asn)/Glu-tRNA(Gln) amidotransferase C subunit
MHQHRELEIAFFIIIILSGVYVAYDLLAEPAGGHPFGHWLGIIGTLLMVMTETLYSLRKRTRLLNRAGPVRWWLSFHIVTGLVGPFLVLMHTGLQFRGLAGLTALLTAVVVVSGFIGRYLYTALQSGIRASQMSQQQLQTQAEGILQTLAEMETAKPARVREMTHQLQTRYPQSSWWERWRYGRQLQRSLNQLENEEARQRQKLAKIKQQQARLEQQAARLGQTRRLFQFWHTVHIPLGLALFTAVAIHILAAFYFRAGLFK